MTRPLVLLRPEPGWSVSAAAARERGIEVIGHPLFAAEAIAWEPPSGQFDALLVGSAAVFANGGAGLAALRHLPVHAVGETTAAAARAAGFSVARTGVGGLQAVLDAAAGEPLRFLRLGGEERVPLATGAGQHLTERAVYRMRPDRLAPELARRLAAGGAVAALHSAAAARVFTQEIERIEVPRSEISLLALGPRIAAAAGAGWAFVAIADHPRDAELLAKAEALCKDCVQGRGAAEAVATGSQNGSG